MSEDRLPLHCAQNGVVAMATWVTTGIPTVNWTRVWKLVFNAKQPNKSGKVQEAVVLVLSYSSAFRLTTETVQWLILTVSVLQCYNKVHWHLFVLMTITSLTEVVSPRYSTMCTRSCVCGYVEEDQLSSDEWYYLCLYVHSGPSL